MTKPDPRTMEAGSRGICCTRSCAGVYPNRGRDFEWSWGSPPGTTLVATPDVLGDGQRQGGSRNQNRAGFWVRLEKCNNIQDVLQQQISADELLCQAGAEQQLHLMSKSRIMLPHTIKRILMFKITSPNTSPRQAKC